MAGYKLKSKRGAVKRFKMTASGKIKRKKANLRHILTKKDSKSKRKMRTSGLVAAVDVPAVKRMMPYG